MSQAELKEDLVKTLTEALARNNVELILSSEPEAAAKRFEADPEGPKAAGEPGSMVSRALSVAADTGLMFFSGKELQAAMGLAEHHVVVVKRSALTPDVLTAYRLALEKAGAEEVFASSSASKTSDIEGKLVWGMHGPRKLTVILEGGG